MIFNEMNSGIDYSLDNVQESPYELGIGGALMHVYENECNYNALMKAAALSEMKYYNETGGDLFVHEAGAFSNLIRKVIEFFKKAIEKIKSIFKKFMMKINQFTMKDKDFVKKYGKELLRKNLKDFDFDGYKFENLNGANTLFATSSAMLTTVCAKIQKGDEDQDAVNDLKEELRGKLIKQNNKLTESDLRDELKEILYGDKETFDIPSIRPWLMHIEDTKKDIKDAERLQKEQTKTITDEIKKLERLEKENTKIALNRNSTDPTPEEAEKDVKVIGKRIEIKRSFVDDMTVCFGAYVKALTDRNRQAKAICVKAMSYKHESASLYSESYGGEYGDIFDGVEIV